MVCSVWRATFGPGPAWVGPDCLITMLDLALPLRQLLEVSDDGFGGQVVEGLVPQVALVVVFSVFALSKELLDVEGDLPLDRVVAP